jgi:phosphatidylserine/phosphatidylglycerophosphate/cardiolipin synthase-like enzyme
LLGPIRAACDNGVTIDLLWGAEKDEETEHRNATAAAAIARLVREDASMRGRVRVHMRTTGSHAKFVFLDTEDGWLAAVGSCNWLSSPFQSVELSVLVRDNAVLSDIATSLQRLAGRRGLADSIASEMALTARDLRRMPSIGGPARMGVVVGEAHDEIMRTASGIASHLFFVGCHRLGSTARPGALLQSEVAARRPGVTATILYTQPSGPLKNRHARALRDEAAQNGVNLIKTGKIPLHGKIVAWGNDDVVVTSLNWASAAADPDFPWADIGIHINAPGVAASTMAKLGKIFPELAEDVAARPATAARSAS